MPGFWVQILTWRTSQNDTVHIATDLAHDSRILYLITSFWYKLQCLNAVCYTHWGRFPWCFSGSPFFILKLLCQSLVIELKVMMISLSICVHPTYSKILEISAMHHAKRSLQALVVVIPKEGWVLYLFWYDTDFLELNSTDLRDYIL